MESATGPEEQPDSEGADSDLKRKFREALDRKRGRSADASPGPDAAEAGRGPSPHGPAHTQRQFRRKSG